MSLGLVGLVVVAVLAVWPLAAYQVRPEIEAAMPPEESELRDRDVERVAVEPLGVRVEVPRDAKSSGPRVTHAQVILVGSIDSEDERLERAQAQVQVYIDSRATTIRKDAPESVSASANDEGAFIVDVTALFLDARDAPTTLRVVAKTRSGRVAFVDTPVDIPVEDLCTPRYIQIGARLAMASR